MVRTVAQLKWGFQCLRDGSWYYRKHGETIVQLMEGIHALGIKAVDARRRLGISEKYNRFYKLHKFPILQVRVADGCGKKGKTERESGVKKKTTRAGQDAQQAYMSSLYTTRTYNSIFLCQLTTCNMQSLAFSFLPSLPPFPSRVRPSYSFAARSFLSNSSINSGGSNSIGTLLTYPSTYQRRRVD